MADKFQESFINEARELLQGLEEALLALEDDMSDLQQIGAVFRVMHTLKGAANMFGFENVGEITHDLETIYDKIRNGDGTLNKNILDVSLQSLDHIGNLINNPGEKFEDDHQNLLNQINQLLGKGETVQKNSNTEKILKKNLQSYYVKVVPDVNIMKNGTNPFFLIEDLLNLGQTYVRFNYSDLPNWSDLDVIFCYVNWELILITDQGEEEIKDVFIFVEDECDVQIQVLENKDISKTTSVKAYLDSESQWDIERIKVLLVEEINKKQQENSKKAQATVRVNADKIDELMNLVSQLITAQGGLSLYAEMHKSDEIEILAETVHKISRQLRDNAFGMSLIPLESILVRFKRMVRDVSTSLGKEVDFIVEGGDTELDKTIIEGITDPLMHMLRNSLDHGVEMPKERLAAGKSALGTVKLKAIHSGAYVNIEISDDGKGIDAARVRNKAIEKGIITENEKLSREEIYALLFAPGFSTAQQVTDISGRGVGMDVVRKKISELRGEILIDSEFGKGSKFTLKLPLTLSIIDGLLVRIGDDLYVIPLNYIQKCYQISHKNFENNHTKLIIMDGEPVPYINMFDEFEIDTPKSNVLPTVVVTNGQKKVSLVVQGIVGEVQAVIKPLGVYYKNQDVFSGSTVLGDGSVALVLDPNRLIENYIKRENK